MLQLYGHRAAPIVPNSREFIHKQAFRKRPQCSRSIRQFHETFLPLSIRHKAWMGE